MGRFVRLLADLPDHLDWMDAMDRYRNSLVGAAKSALVMPNRIPYKGVHMGSESRDNKNVHVDELEHGCLVKKSVAPISMGIVLATHSKMIRRPASRSRMEQYGIVLQGTSAVP